MGIPNVGGKQDDLNSYSIFCKRCVPMITTQTLIESVFKCTTQEQKAMQGYWLCSTFAS
jgi:hypothetical protein